MGFKRRSKSQLALNLLDTQAGQELVKERLESIESELASLESARRQLETERSQLAPLIRGGGRRRRANSNNGSSRRSISNERVLGALDELGAKSSPASKSEIAQHLSANPQRLKKPLDALIEEGVIERVGRGRGTRYRQL